MLQRRTPLTVALLAAAATSLATTPAVAQNPAPGTVTASAAVVGVYQFNTDLDDGGDFRWTDLQASGTITRQFTSDFAAGLTLRYDYQDWSFGSPTAFGGNAPWSNVRAATVGVNLTWLPTPEWRIGFNPTFEWSGESGADAGESLDYGAVVSATRIFSPDLVLGLGAGVFRQLEDTKVFPFIVVNWKITDRLRLTNPLPAGPAGGAGLELAYALSDGWELGAGGSYRSYRFRLDEHGAVPNGIGENRFFPVFARLSYGFGPATRLNFYAAAFVNGELNLMRADGSDLASDDYDVAPAIGVSFTHRF
jgi:hypothetical protein